MEQPVLEVKQVDKQFPGVHALEAVDFDLFEGEVHIVLGENGAGKSTLMKILSGSLRKDSGSIRIRGQEADILNPQHARELGIGMVYQEFSLIPSLSVTENIFLGRLPTKGVLHFVNWDRIYAEAEGLLRSLGGDLDPRTPVRQLGTGERQLVEIAKALSTNASILLLDEPTSALSEEERARLFDLIRGLQGQGVSIVYVSHRLAEVAEIGQRITVLRDGQKAGTLPVEEADEDLLIRMMVGREMEEQFPKEKVKAGVPLLRVEGLTKGEVFSDVSFTLHEGEILGIFGLMGAGRTDVAKALFGIAPCDSGDIYVNGKRVEVSSVQDAVDLGLGYLTEDRKIGLVPRLSIPPNITLASLDRVCRLGLLRHRVEEETASGYVDTLQIQTPHLRQKMQFLSGGNQQKVLLARWLCTHSRILILDEPTRGIDVGAKAEVFRLMTRLAAEGVGIIMISSELPEVLAMADRILVMADGQIVAEHDAAKVTPEEIMHSAAGGKQTNG